MTTQTKLAPKIAQGLKDRLPTAAEISNASHVATAIADAMGSDDGLELSGQDSGSVEVAPAVGELIIEALGYVSAGNMVSLVPVSAMLTTQEAAAMLNVSRPHLTKLVGRGEIKLEEWGKHRRVSLSALMDNRAKRNVMQEAALQEISRLGQECSQA